MNEERQKIVSPVGSQKYLNIPSGSSICKKTGNSSLSQKKSMSRDKCKSKSKKGKEKEKKNNLHEEYFQKPTLTPASKKNTRRNFFGPTA